MVGHLLSRKTLRDRECEKDLVYDILLISVLNINVAMSAFVVYFYNIPGFSFGLFCGPRSFGDLFELTIQLLLIGNGISGYFGG